MEEKLLSIVVPISVTDQGQQRRQMDLPIYSLIPPSR